MVQLIFESETHNLSAIAIIVAIAVYALGPIIGSTIGIGLMCFSSVYSIASVGEDPYSA